MYSKAIKKKRLFSIISIFIGLPLAIASATSQNLIMGALFGSLFALGLDSFIDSVKVKRE